MVKKKPYLNVLHVPSLMKKLFLVRKLVEARGEMNIKSFLHTLRASNKAIIATCKL